jgi:hypothetical protein
MPDPNMIRDGKNKSRKALLLIALIVGMLAVLTFAAPYNPFLQKAVRLVTGKTIEITYCHLVQNRERLDQNLIKCRAKIAADKSGLHLYGCVIDGNANTTAVLISEDVVLDTQAKQWLEKLRSQGNEDIVSSEATFIGAFDSHFSPGCWTDAFSIQLQSIERPAEISRGY